MHGRPARTATRSTSSRAIGIILTLAAIFIALALTWLIVRNTVRQLGKDPGELNAIAHRVVDGDYNVDDGGKKMGVYGSIVEMVNALKTNIENAQRESENAREQSRKAQEAMQQAEAASREAQSKTEAMLVAADKLEQVGSVVSSRLHRTFRPDRAVRPGRGRVRPAPPEAAGRAENEMNATVQEVARERQFRFRRLRRNQGKAEARARWKRPCGIDQVHQMSLSSRTT